MFILGALSCPTQAQPHYSHHGNNLVKQPGPAEALKQVLFRLQAVEAELQHHQQPKASLSPSVEGPLQQVGIKSNSSIRNNSLNH